MVWGGCPVVALGRPCPPGASSDQSSRFRAFRPQSFSGAPPQPSSPRDRCGGMRVQASGGCARRSVPQDEVQARHPRRCFGHRHRRTHVSGSFGADLALAVHSGWMANEGGHQLPQIYLSNCRHTPMPMGRTRRWGECSLVMSWTLRCNGGGR